MTTTSILVFETVLALIEVSALALLALEFRSQSLDRRSSAAACAARRALRADRQNLHHSTGAHRLELVGGKFSDIGFSEPHHEERTLLVPVPAYDDAFRARIQLGHDQPNELLGREHCRYAAIVCERPSSATWARPMCSS
jgi:hypothetical protein